MDLPKQSNLLLFFIPRDSSTGKNRFKILQFSILRNLNQSHQWKFLFLNDMAVLFMGTESGVSRLMHAVFPYFRTPMLNCRHKMIIRITSECPSCLTISAGI